MRQLLALTCRAAALSSALGLCAVAPAAAETLAPPGNSGVDQYLEVVPTAKGPAAPGGPEHALPASARAKLRRAGAEGRRLERIVRATGPVPGAPADRLQPDGQAGDRATSRPPRDDAPITALAKAMVSGSGLGGMGAALPVLLIVSTAVLAAIALRRRPGG